MNKTNVKIIISIALIILIIIILTSNVFAVSNPNFYDPKPELEKSIFSTKAGRVLGLIQYIGVVVSVVALAIIGIKYLLSSVEGKAEYKKTMWPYLTGCFMLMCTCLIIEIIEQIAK